jgi:hypothetical protein
MSERAHYYMEGGREREGGREGEMRERGERERRERRERRESLLGAFIGALNALLLFYRSFCMGAFICHRRR